MLRIYQITDAHAAKAYYRTSDYYLESPGEWLGKGADRLGLRGQAEHADFETLCDNLHPQTGKKLTAKSIEGRRTGWDFNFNSSKSVGLALELTGDARVLDAHREAVEFAMVKVEADMQTRVRGGGRNEDRTTGNLVAMHVIHRTTRPNEDDQRPDPALHSHVVVFNATFDSEEERWKAAQIGQIKHDGPYYEAIYHNRLAANLRRLGYGIRRKGKAFEINGVSDELVRKFSRRTQQIEALAAELGITSDDVKSKLGATTRQSKSDGLVADLANYWSSRLTPREREQLGTLLGQESYHTSDTEAVRFAIDHLFERQSVVDARRLYAEALRFGVGSVTPDTVVSEAGKQGVLLRDGQATTKEVLSEERHIITFARQGRGTMQSLGTSAEPSASAGWAKLSSEQQAAVRHIWESTDQVMMIRGGAGTGKTSMMKTAVAGIDRPVIVLAPSAEASRGVLRREGFDHADTVARFLVDESLQQQARDGVMWVDEAGLLGIRQLDQLFGKAKELGARVILQGDQKQHASVDRGATLRVLEEFAGLPVVELADIKRQRGAYREAVAAIAAGRILEGFDRLDGLGWVKETPAFDHNKPLVDDYLASATAGKEVLVVAPTHAEADEITAALRERLKDAGMIHGAERTFATLKPLGWTQAQRGDAALYEGQEVLQFVRNSGTYRAGQRVSAASIDWQQAKPNPAHFVAYGVGEVTLAAGDTIRLTANGKTKEGKHKLNNGATYRVAGFTETGDLRLQNGWTVGQDFGHVAHGLVSTSHASQGRTVDRVLIAMGQESKPAINASQMYVSASRGREQATIYSNIAPSVLRSAIQRSDPRRSATELMRKKRRRRIKDRASALAKKARRAYCQIRDKAIEVLREPTQEKEVSYAR
jgi:conjugative relaxase-like TrwC/TraI family protein